VKTKSAKAKGRRLQSHLAERILYWFPSLQADDVRPAVMGESGEDIKLSPKARTALPASFECKNTEALNVWAAMAQCEANAPAGTTPVLVFSRNRSKVYAVVAVDELLAGFAVSNREWRRPDVEDLVR
jgi:hypothetical protein